MRRLGKGGVHGGTGVARERVAATGTAAPGTSGTAAVAATAAAPRLRGRIRARWEALPIMRTFFCYTVLWIALSAALSFTIMAVLLEGYNALVQQGSEDMIEVDSGPYVYDEQTAELVPAVSIELGSDYEHIAFLGMRSGTGRATQQEGSVRDVIDAGTEIPVVYATVGLLSSDDSLKIFDWGGNYTEEAYIAAGGNPYDPEALDVDDLAAYDARQRVDRIPVDDSIAQVDDGNADFVISNVGYYVQQGSYFTETAPMLALRIAAGLAPFAVMGVLAVVLFRRFYRTRLAAPLARLGDATDRVAAQDLDFAMPPVTGREFGRLAAEFEHMRASLVESQQELWRTAEERRRLNAAFAHDLRTPVTVLKGTVEMAQMRAERGELCGADTLATIAGQVSRLERYAVAMSGIAKLEDREVVRTRTDASSLAGELSGQATDTVAAQRPDVAFGVDAQTMLSGSVLWVDRALVEEVLGNLLSNACAHAAARVELALALDGAAHELILRVADDGPGFSPEALRRGCDPFYGESKSAEHFGLGLNIVRTLAHLHGGSVELSNAASGGGAVTVTFGVDEHDR